MTRSLYTAADIKKEKEKLYQEQQGIDPILKEKILPKDSVCDHDHTTQHCRAALHRQSNAFEGLCFNAYKRCLMWLTDKPLPDILRNLADYLEQDFSKNPYHNGWIKKINTEFNKLKEADKDKMLNKMQIASAKNASERKKSFQKAILTRDYSYDILRNFIGEIRNEN
jgi:hypothetical protein